MTQTLDELNRELSASYVELGRAIAQKAAEQSLDFAKSTHPKQCDRGLSCKNGCVDPRKSCAVTLEGQAKTYAGWLQAQIKAGAATLERSGTQVKPKTPKDTGEDNPETLHGWLIYKGKEVIGEELAQKLDAAFNPPMGMQRLKNEYEKADKAYEQELARLGDDVDAAIKTPAGRRSITLANQILALEKKADEERHKVMEQVQQRLLDTGMPREEAIRLAYSVKANQNVAKAYGGRDVLNEDLATFFQITGGAGASSLKKIVQDDERAYADPDSGKLNIGSFKSDTDKLESLFHEGAHHAEAEKEFTRNAMISWVQARAEEEGKQVPLNQILGRNVYDEDETAYKDTYANPYVGKTYQDEDGQDYFTEVLSVGTEHFVNPQNMAKLYRKDPNHFWLTIGAYRDND